MWGGSGRRKLCLTIWISKLSKRKTNVQGRVPWVWGEGGGQERQNGSGWNLRGGFSLLLLPPTSLLESQMDDGAIGHVIVGQRIGILDEDALENRKCISTGQYGLKHTAVSQLPMSIHMKQIQGLEGKQGSKHKAGLKISGSSQNALLFLPSIPSHDLPFCDTSRSWP